MISTESVSNIQTEALYSALAQSTLKEITVADVADATLAADVTDAAFAAKVRTINRALRV
jgi:hypothetical protein